MRIIVDGKYFEQPQLFQLVKYRWIRELLEYTEPLQYTLNTKFLSRQKSKVLNQIKNCQPHNLNRFGILIFMCKQHLQKVKKIG